MNLISVCSTRALYPLLVAANYGCIWTITVICIHRFFGICYPLSSRGMSALRHNRILLSGITAVAVAINLVRYWELQLGTTPDGSLTLAAGPFHRSKSQAYQIVVDGVVYVALLYAIPLVLLTAMNTRIIAAIYKAKAAQARLCSAASPALPGRNLSACSQRSGSIRVAAGRAVARTGERRRAGCGAESGVPDGVHGDGDRPPLLPLLHPPCGRQVRPHGVSVS